MSNTTRGKKNKRDEYWPDKRNGWNPTCPHDLFDAQLTLQQKFLWLILKWHCGPGNRCYPSIKRMAYFMGLSERQTQRVLDDLIKNRVIDVERREGKTNVYIISDDKLRDF
jgi:hypothetical protein